MKSQSPISYYGGKSTLIPELIKLIPPHVQYVEPFCGSCALFFSKPPSQVEVINDYDNRVTNFWFCLQNHFEELQKLIKQTLHSEEAHKRAAIILKNGIITPEGVINPVECAWAFWVRCNMSFGSQMFTGFAFGNDNSCELKCLNKKLQFDKRLYKRMNLVQIFCRDALEVVKLKDGTDTFIYCDPPYYNSDCGHYKGYTQQDFENLLSFLSTCKSKFLLSSYPSDLLDEFRKLPGMNSKDIKQGVLVDNTRKESKTKIECLTYNYPNPNNQSKLF